LALPALPRVHVRTRLEQHPNGGHVACPRRRHQRGLAVGQRLVRIGAMGEQQLEHRGAAVLAREEERPYAVAVRRRRARSRVEKRLGDLRVVRVHSPREGRRPVRVGLIRIGTTVEKRPYGRAVLCLDGGNQCAVAGHRIRAKEQEREQCRGGYVLRSRSKRLEHGSLLIQSRADKKIVSGPRPPPPRRGAARWEAPDRTDRTPAASRKAARAARLYPRKPRWWNLARGRRCVRARRR